MFVAVTAVRFGLRLLLIILRSLLVRLAWPGVFPGCRLFPVRRAAILGAFRSPIIEVAAGSAGPYDPRTVEFAGLASGCDCRAPMILGREQCAVSTGSVFVLSLRWQSRPVRLA